MEHFGKRQLAADLRPQRGGNLQSRLRGLPLMSTTPRKIGMTPPHPGEFIRDEILAELSLSVSEAADVLGVRRATLSDLINGKAALSPEMALRIEKAFGVDMETLLRMQAWYDANDMRHRAGEIDVKRYHRPRDPASRSAVKRVICEFRHLARVLRRLNGD